MSAQPVSTRRPTIVEHAARVRSVCIEWGISRRALGEHAPEGSATLITLRYEASHDQHEHWTLLDPDSKSTAKLPERITHRLGVPGLRVAGGRVHVHSPMLYAFVSIDNPDEHELLYARTPIFELLGVAGGRYQTLGARVDTTDHA